jgi:hypothetical protein
MSEDPRESSRAGPRCALRFGNRVVPLEPGELVLGRATDCNVTLDGALVSRRHARIVVSTDRITIEDLGSRNGVQVDGKTIEGPAEVSVGSKLQLGDIALSIVRLDQEMKRRITASDLRSARTIRFEVPTNPEPVLLAQPAASSALDETTLRGRSLELLGKVAEKALALGRGAEAERVLGTLLNSALGEARKSRTLSPEMAENAARYSVKLAAATGNARWLDYPIQLFSALGQPLPLPVVDEMFEVLRKVRGIDRRLLDDYIELLRGKKLGPAARFALQRIEGLARLAAL